MVSKPFLLSYCLSNQSPIMKRMDLFCASPSSTAICSSLDHRSMVRHGTKSNYRQSSRIYAPCSSQLPFDPKRYYDHQKSRKTSASESYLHRNHSSADNRKSYAKPSDLLRKSSADISDLNSPFSSSRNLLSDDRPYIDWISDYDQVSALVPSQTCAKLGHTSSIDDDFNPRRLSSLGRDTNNFVGHVSAFAPSQQAAKSSSGRHISSTDSPALLPSSSARSHDRVVVLRVSIHCKGCEEKVRKHISKMQGVTSFSIDLATKKVVIVGDVTPSGVLASMSKVKNAQLWPSPTATSSLPSPSPRWST